MMKTIRLFIFLTILFGCKGSLDNTNDIFTNAYWLRQIIFLSAGGLGSSITTPAIANSPAFTISSVSNLLTSINSNNIPGSTINILGTGFSTDRSKISVTVANVSAVVLTIKDDAITFTMPDLSSTITENQLVTVSLTSDNKTSTSTIKYFAVSTININTFNAINRVLQGTEALNSHWYKFINNASTINLVNTSGYTNRRIALNIYSSATTPAISSTGNNVSFLSFHSLRTSSMVPNSTYFLEVILVSGAATAYDLGLASGQVTGAGRCNVHGTNSVCADFLINNTLSQTTCAGFGGTYTAGANCAALGLGTIVGRCTAAYTTNIDTTFYYNTGPTPFGASSANAQCAANAGFIFQ